MSNDQINAVLIALTGDTILLPNTAVADVLSHELLQKAGDGLSALAGHVKWNDSQIPVVNFEVLNGAVPKQEASRRARITLLRSIGQAATTIGVITQGYPHLVTLNREAVRPGTLLDTDRKDLVIARARISSQVALIPDFDMLEKELASLQEPTRH